MFSRLLRPGKRSLESLSEQEVLALAISSTAVSTRALEERGRLDIRVGGVGARHGTTVLTAGE